MERTKARKPRFSAQSAKMLKEKGLYLRVPERSNLKLRGALKMFERDKEKVGEKGEFVYVRDWRVAGYVKDVVEFLSACEVGKSEIDAALKNSYSYKNYDVSEKEGGLREAFLAEISEKAGLSLSELPKFVEKLSSKKKDS